MLKELYERQSIRHFTTQKVEEEKIEKLLRAAMNAPTARNRQDWRFLVIRNKEALNTMQELQRYTGMMKEAACAILVMSDTKETDSVEYSYVDCAAAIENILIEGVHLGLGTCWCAVGPKQERIDNFRQYYHLEDTLLPVGVIAVGYPAETKEKVDRYDPQKVTYFD